jgi:6-phosphogluconate dehydrogenase
MTEAQLSAFTAFKTLPVYDESDERADAIMFEYGNNGKVKECTTLAEVVECLKNPKLIPLGGLRAGPEGQKVVVIYFGEIA